MNGKSIAGFLVLTAAVAGAVLWYTSNHAFYNELPQQRMIELGGQAHPIEGFEGIDATSSPIKLRACFRIQGDISKDFPSRDDAIPLVAPPWFECFDAERIHQDLRADRARALIANTNTPFGFDRYVAIYPDGRGYMWRQMNECGKRHFDGKQMPEGCPSPNGAITK